MWQKLPVYKIIDYHPDGTHTCLDAGSNPASGSMIDSYGCDPQQFNQTNQLWIIADSGPDQTYPYEYSNGNPYLDGNQVDAQPGWLSAYLQDNPWTVPNSNESVIENVAALQASGWDTDQAPVLSASYTNITGVNSLVGLRAQQFPADLYTLRHPGRSTTPRPAPTRPAARALTAPRSRASLAASIPCTPDRNGRPHP